jgi:tRNA modification GTPase
MASADHLLVLADVVGRELPQASLPANIPRTLVINKIDLLEDTLAVRPADTIAGSLSSDWQAADWLAEMTHAAGTSIENGETLTVLPISVKTGQGVNELREHLMSLAGHDPQLEGAFIARRRHLDALQQAQAATKEALARLTEGTMPELAAEELRLAQQALDTITGKFDSEDLLGRIFTDFCIGK